MPGQQGFGGDDGGHLGQHAPSQLPRSDCQATALVVVQLQSSRADLGVQNAVLLSQVVKARLSGANCGSAWSQTFGFDVFGNINKFGSQSFTPSYNASTNRINGGGYSASYDGNGDMTNDGMSPGEITYTWDANGNPRTITRGSTSVTVIYDALGRAVENQSGGSYTQILYGPNGDKLALMNGGTLVKAFVGLPGGAQAVYSSSGLAYYRHSDWLGSSRLASNPDQTLHFSGAYAPYGEDYAKTGTTDLSFTGQNQDTISGLHDFMFRRYNPVHGRWMSPDPAGLGAVDLSNPQSLNRYAYVLNNPTNWIDPLGLLPMCWVVGPPEDRREECIDAPPPPFEPHEPTKQGGNGPKAAITVMATPPGAPITSSS